MTVGAVDAKSTVTLMVEGLTWFGMSEGTCRIGAWEGITDSDDMEELAVGAILAVTSEVEAAGGASSGENNFVGRVGLTIITGQSNIT